jgi:hypothetical protein
MTAFEKIERGLKEAIAKTYREHLNETLREGVPDWAAQLLAKLK